MRASSGHGGVSQRLLRGSLAAGGGPGKSIGEKSPGEASRDRRSPGRDGREAQASLWAAPERLALQAASDLGAGAMLTRGLLHPAPPDTGRSTDNRRLFSCSHPAAPACLRASFSRKPGERTENRTQHPAGGAPGTPSASLRPAHRLLRSRRVGIQFLLNHLYKLKPRGREPPWCGLPRHFLLTQFMECTTSMDCTWRETRTVCCGHLLPDREIPTSLLYSYCLSFVNMNPSGLKGRFSKIAFASLHQARCR